MTSTVRLTEHEMRRARFLAWVVLLAALAAFLVAAVGLPVLGLRYLRTATVTETVDVEPKTGSVAIESVPGVTVLLQPGGPSVAAEGATISTDASSRAFVRFRDGSTLNIEPYSRVTLRRLRVPRFRLGQGTRQIELFAEPQPGALGRLLAGAAWGDATYRIHTDLGSVLLGPQTHLRLDCASDRVDVVVTEGEAVVANGSRELTLAADQRAQLREGDDLHGPLPAAANILSNGGFDEGVEGDVPMPVHWLFSRSVPTGGGLVQGDSQIRSAREGRTVLAFDRHDSEGTSADMVYEQSLGDVDIGSSSFLGISATLRVWSQSLAGGGIMRSEFPVSLHLIYESASGEDGRWRVGFYSVPAAEDDPNRAELERYDVLVPAGEWYSFSSGNLLDPENPRGFQQSGLPTPVRLRRFEVVASGHDYESEIDSVGLWVK